MFDLISHISDLRLSALCLCASAPLHLTKLSSFVIVFMQNKANFQKSQVNVILYNTTDYENKSNWTLGENKPNSNPIKANLHFTAENTEYAEKKDISVSDCSIEKYALYAISPCSLRTRRLMKNKAKTKPIGEDQYKTKDPRHKTKDTSLESEVWRYCWKILPAAAIFNPIKKVDNY